MNLEPQEAFDHILKKGKARLIEIIIFIFGVLLIPGALIVPGVVIQNSMKYGKIFA